MPESYVDTTIVVEALLKTRKRREIALAKLRSEHSVLSVYALKEFKGGPLDHWVWLHNKLVSTRSLKSTYSAIGQNLRRPYRVGTALEALQVAIEALVPQVYASKKTSLQIDRAHAEAYALAIRRRIIAGWRDRKKITDELVGDVDCFSQAPPYFDEITGLIENPHKKCDPSTECGFAKVYKSSPANLVKLIAAMKGQSRNEDNRRRAALHKLSNTPRRPFLDQDCRDLGDAHFALTCPPTAQVLTSNDKDHQILCAPLGITVEKFVIQKP